MLLRIVNNVIIREVRTFTQYTKISEASGHAFLQLTGFCASQDAFMIQA